MRQVNRCQASVLFWEEAWEKAIACMVKRDRWAAFTVFLEDGRVCLTNNAAERAGDRAAVMSSLIVTAKTNDIDPQAWLADVLARLPNTTASRVPVLLPWNWLPSERQLAA